MNDREQIRTQIAAVLDWRQAHATFDDAVKDVSVTDCGIRPEGLPHSLWELLEHIRLAQRDILEYCLEGDYHEKQWPQDYWPTTPEPPEPEAWDASVAAYHSDLDRLKRLALEVDPFATVPHSDKHTYIREFFVTADHTAYHVGQMVLVRKALENWGG